MSYAQFKPTIWSKAIQMALEKRMILTDFCSKQFQGEIGMGKKVKIIGIGDPTVKTYTPGSDIDAAETPADTSVFMDIDQYKYTNFIVDDVDEAQSVPGLMDALVENSARVHAENRDAFVGSLAASAANKSTSTSCNTADKCAAAIDKALVTLWANGVRSSDGIRIECSPWFFDRVHDKLIAAVKPNPELAQNLGDRAYRYKGAEVVMSNFIYNDGTDDYVMVRTNKAVAFAGGIAKTEAYRPDARFADAMKVLDTYGGKIIRQEQLYVIKAHNS